MTRFDAVIGERAGALQDHHGVLVEKTTRAGGDHAGLEQRRQQLVVDP